MESLFVNNIKQTKEMYIEMNKAYTSASRVVYLLAVIVIYGILAFSLAYFNYNYIGAAIIGALGILLCFYPCFFC